MLDTLETVYGRDLRDVPSPLEYVVRRWWKAPMPPPREAIVEGLDVGVVPVRVNHGRWLVDCPVYSCGGAMPASDTQRRTICPYCGAGPFEVIWPSDADRAKIETALAVRPVEHQHWEQGDDPDDDLAASAAWVAFTAMSSLHGGSW